MSQDPEATNPGLTQDADGVISIGSRASKASRERAEREAFAHAQEKVIAPLNEITESTVEENYYDGEGGSPGTLPDKDAA